MIVSCCTDDFNCEYFLNKLVWTYLNSAILPPYGGARLFDIYNSNQKNSSARNSAGQLDMVDTVGRFARGESFPNMQSNMSSINPEWCDSDPAATLASLPHQNAAELRDTAIHCSLPTKPRRLQNSNLEGHHLLC